MFFIAIIGDRKRNGDHEEDAAHVRNLVENESVKPGDKPVFVSIGCDMGIGKVVKDTCALLGMPFVEMSCMFHQFGEASSLGAHVQAYLSRNAAIYALCQVFYLFVRNTRHGIIEDLVSTLTHHPKPQAAVLVYNEANDVIHSVGFEGGVTHDKNGS